MATDSEQLAAIKSQTLQLIKDITVSPKPTYDIDGQSVSWNEYLQRLQATVDWCDAKAAAYEPFEIDSQGYT